MAQPSAPAAAPAAIQLDRESFDKAVQIADDVWIIATRHRPGFSKMNPEINNRALIFRLQEGGKPLLLVANGVDPKMIPEVRRIEREAGLEVRYILSPGGGHHLQLPPWRDAFTAATVLVPPVRIPSTPSAAKLMQGPRVKVMSVADPLPQFKGQLECVIFDGLLGFPDMRTPYEGGKEGFFTFFKMMSVFGLEPPAPSAFSTCVIFGMRSTPCVTLPKMLWRWSSHGVAFSVMKNCEPLVFGPLFAMDK